MATPAKTRLAGTSVATLIALLSGVATSRAADTVVVNGQLQFGDVISSQTLNVEEASDGVAAGATAVGNIVAATGNNQRLDFQSDQTLGAKVEAAASVEVAGSAGPYFSSGASATGNSATAGTCCFLTYGAANQTIQANGVVSADSYSTMGGTTEVVGVDSSAVGNTMGWAQINGEVQAWTQQVNQGRTYSSNQGLFEAATGNVGLTSTSVANNVTVDAQDAVVDVGFDQSASGGTDAFVELQLGQGTDSQAMATGVGNNVDAQVSSPDAAMNGRQVNSGPVTAYADSSVASWSGDANTVAYGVGNSVVMSNNGPATRVWSDQTNSGEVTVGASFTGGAGANVFTSATAMGNAASGYGCSACGGALDATNNQVGSARVRANSAVRVSGRARTVTAEASAIGNSATYQISSPE